LLEIKDVFVSVHGHFYQPPRENPWLDAIEREESARPFHDWNERIAFECYQPNAYARILDSQGKILDIINNYSSISFNFGPTLLSWIESKMPSVYRKILDADQVSLKRLGHGNAIGQVYNHIIMPLATERDKETEIRWGIADFERRFRRRPDAIWLPETAVDYATLQALVRHGMRFLILSPFQASKVRPFAAGKWMDVSSGKIDPTQPYRCFIKDKSGRKIPDRFIDIFFYHGGVSKEVGFEDLLKDGNAFCDRFLHASQPSRKRPQLLHISTDGETYGHHKKFGDMALAYAVHEGFSSRGMEVTNYGAFLERFPPVYEVEIDEGPKGEGTSWSCSHGVGRWKEDCGCSTGAMAGWNQGWREPLREALNFLRDELSHVFEREGANVFKDAWEARNVYIEVIVDRSPEMRESFFKRHGTEGLDERGIIKGLKLLEMERNALQMYTSCGWFFADLAGLETVIILQHAARAIQLAEELTGPGIEKEFLRRLSKGRSNLPEMGDGAEIYHRLVRPGCVTLDKMVNHHAISSLFDGKKRRGKIYCYGVEKMKEEKWIEKGDVSVLGQVKVSSEIIPEPKEFLFGLISSSQDIFRTWVAESSEKTQFELLKNKGLELAGKDEKRRSEVLTSILGHCLFTIRDILKDEKKGIFQKLLQEELDQYHKDCSELFGRSRGLIEILAGEGIEIPCEIRAAAETALADWFLKEVEGLRKDPHGTLDRGEIERIVEEGRKLGIELKTESVRVVLNEILDEKVRSLKQAMEADQAGQSEEIDEILLVLHSVERWGFEFSREEAQNRIHEILEYYAETIEKSWWEGGSVKPFPTNLISLAERLGFNVDRFKKLAVHPPLRT